MNMVAAFMQIIAVTIIDHSLLFSKFSKAQTVFIHLFLLRASYFIRAISAAEMFYKTLGSRKEEYITYTHTRNWCV